LEAQFLSETVKSGDLNGPAFFSQKPAVQILKFDIAFYLTISVDFDKFL